MLTREQILSLEDRATKEVEIPEWGGSVRLKKLSAQDLVDIGNMDDVQMYSMKVLTRAAVNEDGTPMFTEADVGALMQKSGTAIAKLLSAASDMNQEDVEKN